jgi:hypothetical protein
VGLGEAIQPMDAPGVAVEQLQHRTPPVLIPQKKEQMMGAEVERGGRKAKGVGFTPALWAVPLRGSPAGLLR